MNVVVIGGSGHVGTYLIPRLVESGHRVTNISRQIRLPYKSHSAWKMVKQVCMDREAEEAKGIFGKKVAELKADIVIDMICFTLESSQQIVNALFGKVQHFIHCGTIWVHGPSAIVPTTEVQPRRPLEEYGIQKAAIESYLVEESRIRGFPGTILHPGHIVGPGWIPLNPQGNFNATIFSKLARGDEVALPNIGMETVHHVHADDVAQSFMLAIQNRGLSLGECFHIVSPAALTLRGYAEAVADWFGNPPNLKYLQWEQFCETVATEDAHVTWEHITHSPNCSIEKGMRVLGYQPRFTSLQGIYESISWLIDQKIIVS